jgi:glyoxylase-like metal-dependent hydrolase (beta-lactamase superfamily II)
MGNNCNSYLFAGDVPTLIDPGMVVDELNEPCLERLLSSIRKDGFRPEDIKLIILTHSHPDHAGAAQNIIEMSSARLGLHQLEDEFSRTIGAQLARLFGVRSAEIKPDFFLKEGELHLGKGSEIRLTILHTPGHSPGSISLYWPQGKALISGDVVFDMSVGRVDIPGGDGRLLKESIEKLSKLDVEYLLPGHMGIVAGKKKVEDNFSYVMKMFFPWI